MAGRYVGLHAVCRQHILDGSQQNTPRRFQIWLQSFSGMHKCHGPSQNVVLHAAVGRQARPCYKYEAEHSSTENHKAAIPPLSAMLSSEAGAAMVSLSSGSSEALSARRKLRALFRRDMFSAASPAAGHAQLTPEVWAKARNVQQLHRLCLSPWMCKSRQTQCWVAPP